MAVMGNTEAPDNMNRIVQIKASKKLLREATRAKLATLDGENVAAQSAAIVGTLTASDVYKKAKHISVYMSMPTGEVVTTKIIENALASGKTVYVPFIAKPSGQKSKFLEMVSLHSSQDFGHCKDNRDRWGIPSISPESLSGRRHVLNKGSAHAETDSATLDMVVVPGLAFDLNCKRLGHGMGFYDQFIEAYRRTKAESDGSGPKMPLLVGLALQEQMMPRGEPVPTGDTDETLDALVVGDGSMIIHSESSEDRP